MAKDHGPSVKNDKQYEALKKKGTRGTSHCRRVARQPPPVAAFRRAAQG